MNITIFSVLFIISMTRGSPLWSAPGFESGELGFLVARNKGSVHVKAYFKQPSAKSKDSGKVLFFLITRLTIYRDHPKAVQLHVNDTKHLLKSGFDFNIETKLLVHGFANSASSNFNKLLIKAYKESQRYNILVVDWSELCPPPFYPTAVGHTQRVAGRVGELLGWLVAAGLRLSQLHAVGHSIGAHICGIVAQHLRHLGRIHRITGLDPAKPMYELESNDYCLSADDAEFVDCIHTCGGFLGSSEPKCSVDFYPNGGVNPQPGCILDIFGTCSHQRAYRFFAESVRDPASFPAVSCARISGYSPAACSSQPSHTMGEHTNNRSRGIFFLATAGQPPFSLSGSSVPDTVFTQFLRYFY